MSSRSNEKLVLKRSKELSFIFLMLPKGLTWLRDVALAPWYPSTGMAELPWAGDTHRWVPFQCGGDTYHPI